MSFCVSRQHSWVREIVSPSQHKLKSAQFPLFKPPPQIQNIQNNVAPDLLYIVQQFAFKMLPSFHFIAISLETPAFAPFFSPLSPSQQLWVEIFRAVRRLIFFMTSR